MTPQLALNIASIAMAARERIRLAVIENAERETRLEEASERTRLEELAVEKEKSQEKKVANRAEGLLLLARQKLDEKTKKAKEERQAQEEAEKFCQEEDAT